MERNYRNLENSVMQQKRLSIIYTDKNLLLIFWYITFLKMWLHSKYNSLRWKGRTSLMPVKMTVYSPFVWTLA